jgi:putative ABC transport system permease protein
MLYIDYELSYDRFYQGADKVYRITSQTDFGGVAERSTSCPAPLAPALQNDYPEVVKAYTRIYNNWGDDYVVEFQRTSWPNQLIQFKEDQLYFVDSTFFNVLPSSFITGNPATALQGPNKIVLTQSTAIKYFGNQDPIGKELVVDNFYKLSVTGIVKDLPGQSHFRYEMLASISTLKKQWRGSLPKTWVWNPFWTYIRIADDRDISTITSGFPGFVKKYFNDAQKNNITLNAQALTSIHLYSNLDYEIEPNGNHTYVKILGFIAVFLLVIASINFMNLSTATASGRAREVSVKKVFGAARGALVLQFLAESFIITLIAILLSVLLINLSLPSFNAFTGKSIDYLLLLKPEGLLFMSILWLIMGLFSGLYPAFFLSSFQPLKVLKGNLSMGSRSAILRKILVVLQFTISVVLIICTFSAFHQLNFLRKADLGFNKQRVIMLPVRKQSVVNEYNSFKAELLSNPAIVGVTGVDYIPGVDHNSHEFKIEGFPLDEWQFYPTLAVRHDFVKTLGIKIVAGRDYNEANLTDPMEGILINEAMVKHLGWKSNENALGKKFSSLHGNEKVIGVFKDINAKSLHFERTPLVLNIKENRFEINYFMNYVALRISPEADLQDVLKFLELKWELFKVKSPFAYYLLDEAIEEKYLEDKRIGQLTGLLATLIIFIAAIGLFGLVSFMASQRTREIGIRKALGANNLSVIYLLSGEFFYLIAISVIIAFPVAFILVKAWLTGFSFHAPISVWIFLLSGVIALLIAFLITLVRALLASHMNPSDALKYE